MHNKININKADIEILRKNISLLEIIPAKVLKKVGQDSFLLELKNVNVVAQSKINLINSLVFVKVESLKPKIHLRLLTSADSPGLDRISKIASNLRISLTYENFTILSRLQNLEKLSEEMLEAILVDYGRLLLSGGLLSREDLLKAIENNRFSESSQLLSDFLNFRLRLGIDPERYDDLLISDTYSSITKAFEIEYYELEIEKFICEKEIRKLKKIRSLLRWLGDMNCVDKLVKALYFPINEEFVIVPAIAEQKKPDERIYHLFYESPLIRCLRAKVSVIAGDLNVKVQLENFGIAEHLKKDLNRYLEDKEVLPEFRTLNLELEPLTYSARCSGGLDVFA